MQNFSTQHAQFIEAINACRKALSSGDRDINQWRKKARAAVQGLSDLENNSNRGGVDHGLNIPSQIEMDLIDFVRDLERTYLWNDLSTITALPAPSSWQNKLKQFAEDLKSKKPVTGPKPKTPRKIDVAIVNVVRNPELDDAEIARRTGCSRSLLTRSKEYQHNADMARRALTRMQKQVAYDPRTKQTHTIITDPEIDC